MGTGGGMGRLDGKVAIVTGGASGIGEATVRLFHAEGARVVAADVQDARGKRLAEELGAGAVYQHADVSQEAEVKALVDLAVGELGRLDCLFNNAGFVGARGPIDTIPVDEFDVTFGVLLRGVFLGMKHAAPVMKRQGSGSIISTASVAGLQAGFGPHPYSAAKAAVVQLTRTVATELGESGVRVNCICPGGIATPLLASAFGEGEAALGTLRSVLAMAQPIRRAGLPEDIARAALWLASDDASFVNGQAIVVDGGLTSGRPWSQTPEAMRRHEPMVPPGEYPKPRA
jgi:NAD(P)-dependent dehydrogenase (short-subunit alcohol dehydrogenase family)